MTGLGSNPSAIKVVCFILESILSNLIYDTFVMFSDCNGGKEMRRNLLTIFSVGLVTMAWCNGSILI